MLKILGKASSINVRKVLWTCDELGLPFEQEDWGSGFRATDTPDYLALNPNAMVPVIQDSVDGAGEPFVLWESNAIIRYLAAAYGDGGLLPATPRERAKVEQWMDWQATELNNSWRYAFVALVRKNPAYQDQAALDASVASWSRHIGILEQQLASTGAYVLGDTFSLADVPLGLSVNRWLMTPLQHPEFPAVRAYFERLSQRPEFLRHGRNGLP